MSHHDLTPGASKYPVVEGYVLKLVDKDRRYNKKLKYECDHTIFIWIMKIYKNRHVQPKLRKVRIFRFYRPVNELGEIKNAWFAVDNNILFEYICRMLKNGYAIVSANCKYDGSLESVGRFYRTIEQF